MKKIILLFVLFCSCFSLRAQNIPIDSFYVPGATWTQAVYYQNSDYHYWSWGVNGIIFRIERDTILSGTKYYLLSVMNDGGYAYNASIYSSEVNYSVAAATNNYMVFGRIRVDSNRVYFTRDSLSTIDYFKYSYFIQGIEYLIYDFNLNIGSSVIDTPGLGLTVASIDSVDVSSGIYIKKYTSVADSGYYWLQGIGSSAGFLLDYALLNMGPFGQYETQTTTLCYSNPSFSYHFQFQDSILLGNLQNDCFDITPMLGVASISKQTTNDLVVYPNPSSEDYLHFAGNDMPLVVTATISDIAGRSVYTFQHPFSAGEKQLFAPLAPGIYTLKTELADQRVIIKKIVKN